MPDIWQYCQLDSSASYIIYLYNVDICQLKTVHYLHFSEATKKLSLRSMSQRQACPCLEWNVHYASFSEVFTFPNKGRKHCIKHKHVEKKMHQTLQRVTQGFETKMIKIWQNIRRKGRIWENQINKASETKFYQGLSDECIWKSGKQKGDDTHWMIICEPKWEIWNKVMKMNRSGVMLKMKIQQHRYISWLSNVNEQNMTLRFRCSKLSTRTEMGGKRSYEINLRRWFLVILS